MFREANFRWENVIKSCESNFPKAAATTKSSRPFLKANQEEPLNFAGANFTILERHHELVVAAEAGGATVHAIVQVRVADVNDNAPHFLQPDPYFTVIEEDDRDLPSVVTKVEARDRDRQDQLGLHYTLSGDGVDGYSPEDAYFTINPRTGELIQQRALDRDAPRGKEVWKVKIQVRDGQEPWPTLQEDSLSSSGVRIRRHGNAVEAERRNNNRGGYRESINEGYIRRIEGLARNRTDEGVLGYKEDVTSSSGRGEGEIKRKDVVMREKREEGEYERTADNGDRKWKDEEVQAQRRGEGERERRGEGDIERRIEGDTYKSKNEKEKQRGGKGMEKRTNQGEKEWRRRRRNVEQETDGKITGKRQSEGNHRIITTLATSTAMRERGDRTIITDILRDTEHQLTIPETPSTKQTTKRVTKSKTDPEDHTHTRIKSHDHVSATRLKGEIGINVLTPSHYIGHNNTSVLKPRGMDEASDRSKPESLHLEKNSHRTVYDPLHLYTQGTISKPELPSSKTHANTTPLKPYDTRIMKTPSITPREETSINVPRHNIAREEEAHPTRRKFVDTSTREKHNVGEDDKKTHHDYTKHVDTITLNNKNIINQNMYGLDIKTGSNETLHLGSTTTKVHDSTLSQNLNRVYQAVNTSTLYTHELRWETKHPVTDGESLKQNASKNAKKSTLRKLWLKNHPFSTKSQRNSDSETPKVTRKTTESTEEKLANSADIQQEIVVLKHGNSSLQINDNLSATHTSDCSNVESINYSDIHTFNSSNMAKVMTSSLPTPLGKSPSRDPGVLNYVYRSSTTPHWVKANSRNGLHHIISKRGLRESTGTHTLSLDTNLNNTSLDDKVGLDDATERVTNKTNARIEFSKPTHRSVSLRSPRDNDKPRNPRDVSEVSYNTRHPFTRRDHYTSRVLQREHFNPRNIPADNYNPRDNSTGYYTSRDLYTGPYNPTYISGNPHDSYNKPRDHYNPRSIPEHQPLSNDHQHRHLDNTKMTHRDHIMRSVLPRSARDIPRDRYTSDHYGDYEDMDSGGGGGCEDVSVFGGEYWNATTSSGGGGRWRNGGGRGRGGNSRVHLVETTVTMMVKDINDNPPVFPNTTMFGEVQENGPIGEYQ
ncbi:hypothetical protein Pmani_035807 [Petrolisthes manimaculis]|uniref:Cadherin domain-containing protein n=1 Tax=Petrolisthes manimaculis TaxID=1843537 RepID=A0AAE1NL01_9EUCA|nr:hypothetical protein Pmani_035807 [Petrolisthes manimaculis]